MADFEQEIPRRRPSDAAEPARLKWASARPTVILRLMLVLSTSLLLFAQGQTVHIEPVAVWLIFAGLASNLPLPWLSRSLIESPAFGAALVVVDTIWITAVLFYGGYRGVDFYVVYFFVLFLAAISENFKLLTLGAVLVSIGYLYSVLATQGPEVALSPSTLIRLPFFLAVAGLYGYLASRVRNEKRAHQNLLQRMASHDPLTDLANRRTLEDQLDGAIERALRTRRRMALLLFDLDNFKDINDSHGHAVGDRLLVAIADRLRHSVRRIDAIGRFQPGEFDTTSRLGGDEFAVVVTEANDLDDLAAMTRRLSDLISEPVMVRGQGVETSASVGIAVLGDETDVRIPTTETTSIEELRQQLLVHADLALYRAKEEGKNTFSFYDREMDEEIRTRRELRRNLVGALGRGEFFVEFQPQVDLQSQSVVGAEALIRWRHPTRGEIPPTQFIPIAEKSGQIQEIDAWVLRTACHEARRWMERHPPGIPVAVNVSAVQFRDPEFPARVEKALHESNLPPHLLELELTERVFLHASSQLDESLDRLSHDIGVRISLDDFGRGFSSLEYLCRFPIHKLKVDQLFVRTLEQESDSRIIVGAILALARELKLDALAEGVETSGQLEFLRAQGCETVQGFYFSKSVSPERLAAQISQGADYFAPR